MSLNNKSGLSLYLHIPFCKTRCSYCDFNTYTNLTPLYGRYTNTLALEIERTLAAVAGEYYDPLQPLPPVVPEWASTPVPLETVFFGGGTPSLLPPVLLKKIMQAINRYGKLSPQAEITAEANPGTLSLDKLRALRDMGINRLSFGVQTFDDALLRSLGRTHNGAGAVEAYDMARRAGFNNVNLDFIYGLPGQTLSGWRSTLERAISLRPEHLSVYALTIEEDTAMGRSLARGAIQPLDDDLLADMYLLALELLAAAGYIQYEISNWALPMRQSNVQRPPTGQPDGPMSNAGKFNVQSWDGKVETARGGTSLAVVNDTATTYACRHNLVYWRNQSYIGFGPGAHSSFSGYRYAVLKDPQEYIRRIGQGQSVVEVAEAEPITPALKLADTIILALRLNEGLELGRIERDYGRSLEQLYPGVAENFLKLGLLEEFCGPFGEARLGLTVRGRLLSNEVFIRFLPD